MTSGEKMRQQVLNALDNSKYQSEYGPTYPYHMTEAMIAWDKQVEGLKVLIRGLPSTDRAKRHKHSMKDAIKFQKLYGAI